MKSIVILATLILVAGAQKIISHVQPDEHEYEITTTWNNRTIPESEIVTVKFTSADEGLGIEIKAPFYNDTMPNAPPGRLDGLWDFEVVEVFLLGDNVHYLELEFGPGGHYLVYYLVGVRTVENATWLLSNYTVSINETDKTWEGQAVIPAGYLPPALNAFNAYGIHGINKTRKYIALFPVDQVKEDQKPDFHRLDAFQPIDLSDLVDIRNSTKDNGGSAASPMMVVNYLINFSLVYFLANFVV